MRISARRAISALVCLCLICAPLSAPAEEPTTHTASQSPVYRSDFTLRLGLDADGFPTGTATDYGAWEDYLKKLSLRGVIDVQDFLQEFSRVYFDGALYLNEKPSLPFTYDGYYSFRYLRSPALAGRSVHFQMHNFLEFMLKGYYFMGLPTQYIALLMYPEASQALAKAYYKYLDKVLGGEGERLITFKKLHGLAKNLQKVQTNDDKNDYRLYFYITSLLIDLNASDDTYEQLGSFTQWLRFLDPDRGGLQISFDDAGNESWVIGGREVFRRTPVEGGSDWSLKLPDASGRELSFSWQYIPLEKNASLSVKLGVSAEGEERVALALIIDALPKDDETEAFGTATFMTGGTALVESAQRFEYRYQRDALELPYTESLGVDWINPVTDAAAITLSYRAQVSEHDNTILVDRAVDDQDDFFHLNESVMEEYKQSLTPTLALGFLPFVIEMPAPVLNDITSWLIDSGTLGVIGLE